MSTINALLKVCVELAKAQNVALRSGSKIVIQTELLQAPYPTLRPGDMCIFTWKTGAAYAGQAGRFCRAEPTDLVFDSVGNISGQIRRVWRAEAGLVVTRVTVVPAPELDKLPADPESPAVQKVADLLSSRLLVARKGSNE